MYRGAPIAGLSTAFLVLAAFFWGVSGGIGAILMADGWGAFVVAFYRGAIGLLFVLVWLTLRPHNSGLAVGRLWFWSALAGLGIAGNFTFYFVSISEGNVAVAVTLMYCAPVFVYMASFALNFEKFTALKGAAIAMVMLGLVLLTGIYDIGASGVSLIGVGTGLLSGMSYAIFIFSFKYAARYGSPQSSLVIAFSIFVSVLTWLGGKDQMAAVLSSPDWPLFAALGVLGAGLSFILYVAGLKRTLPSIAAMLAVVEPVTASLFGIVVLNESLASMQFLGMALILVTVTALSVCSNA